MANRLYFVSSLFFLTGATLAIVASPSPVNDLYFLGGIFFFAAAAYGMFAPKS